jgi:predicted HicB family RNase H-like nuclease
MKDMMQYKGYLGELEFDADAGIFHGEVIGTRDVITFQGDSVAALTRAFHESVDDYLAFCAERNEEPDKPFSGQFVTRLTPEVHRLVNLAATASGVSLNSWVADQLRAAAEVAVGAIIHKRTKPRPSSAAQKAKKTRVTGGRGATKKKSQPA